MKAVEKMHDGMVPLLVLIKLLKKHLRKLALELCFIVEESSQPYFLYFKVSIQFKEQGSDRCF